MNTEHTAFTSFNKVVKSDAVQTILDSLRDGTFSEFLDDWKWIFGFSKKYKLIVLFYTAFGIFGSTLSIGSAYVSRILINIVVGQQRERLPFLIGVMLGMTAFNVVVGAITSRIFTKISIYVNNDMQATIFDHILDARWKELSAYPSGDLLNRFNNDVGTISSNAVGWIPNLVINIYTFAATFLVLFRLDAVMAWIALLSAPFLLIMSRHIMRRQKKYRKRILELNSGMMGFETETFLNFEMIKSFGVFGYFGQRLRQWQQKYKEYSLDYNMFHIKTNILMTLVGTLVSMTAFGYCLFRLWSGAILYGDMTFFLQQRGALSSRFSSLVGTIPGMLNSAISAHRIRELVDLPAETHDGERFRAVERVAAQGLTVRMNDVTFSYGKRDRIGATSLGGMDAGSHEPAPDEPEIYTRANIRAAPGEIVAILAPSGGGKTTFMRLLLGMLEPDSGSVTLTTRTGESVDVNADMRLFFSYVPQGNTILSGSVAENMRMVREDVSDGEIIEALETACAWDFVKPVGINARMGERGRGISEGQAQRLSIARALVRKSPILLLDEATSALDIELEERVLRNIIKSDPNKVIIVSTHRPSVLRMCDRIYRIADGDIREIGAEDVIAEPRPDAARRTRESIKIDAEIPDLSNPGGDRPDPASFDPIW